MDARALLRAKKAEGRIDHPHASYNNAGQLRCSICAVPVKQWDAHIMTKQHRQSVSREQASSTKSKRPAESTSSSGVATSSKRAKTGDEPVIKSSILPAGFFSSGSGPTIVADDDDDEEEAEEAGATKAGPSTANTTAPQASAMIADVGQTGDQELDSFLASLAEPDPEPEPSTSQSAPSAATASSSGKAKTPSVIKHGMASYKDVIPGQASYEAAPVRNVPQNEQAEEEVEPEVKETEEEKRARMAREEREEMMDRLDEETRAQEDADQRVAALKARMEALKKRREGRPKAAGKAKGGTNGA